MASFKTVPSDTYSTRLSHSPETWGCKVPRSLSNTCSTRTTAAPDELLSTPLIPEKVACDQLLKWHSRLEWDSFMQVSVWKWSLWHVFQTYLTKVYNVRILLYICSHSNRWVCFQLLQMKKHFLDIRTWFVFHFCFSTVQRKEEIKSLF